MKKQYDEATESVHKYYTHINNLERAVAGSTTRIKAAQANEEDAKRELEDLHRGALRVAEEQVSELKHSLNAADSIT